MSKLLAHPIARFACWYLSALFAGFFAFPAVAQAAFVPSAPASAPADEAALATLRASLETDLLRDRLSALGVSPDEARARLDNLSPDERQAVLADMDRIQAGGDGVIGLLVLVILIIILVKLLNKEVIIK